MGCRVVNVWPRRCQSDCKDCIRLHSATKGNERKEENGKKKDKTTRKSLNIDTAVGTILSSGPTEGDWHLNLKSQTSRSRTSLFGVCLCVCLSLSWCQGYSQSPAIFLFGTTKKKPCYHANPSLLPLIPVATIPSPIHHQCVRCLSFTWNCIWADNAVGTVHTGRWSSVNYCYWLAKKKRVRNQFHCLPVH